MIERELGLVQPLLFLHLQGIGGHYNIIMTAAHRLVSSTASRKLFSTSASTASNIFDKITFIGEYQ
jgi:hypothetical protein